MTVTSYADVSFLVNRMPETEKTAYSLPPAHKQLQLEISPCVMTKI